MGKPYAEEIVKEHVVQKMLYRTYRAENCCTGKDCTDKGCKENVVQDVV